MVSANIENQKKKKRKKTYSGTKAICILWLRLEKPHLVERKRHTHFFT